MGQEEIVWERINCASPVSLVIRPDVPDERFVDGLLDRLAPQIRESGIAVIRFSCAGYTRPMDFWLSLFDRVVHLCEPLIDADFQDDLEDSKANVKKAVGTNQVYLGIKGTLELVPESGEKALLVLEDFESVFGFLSLAELAAFRSFTDDVTVMTVSSVFLAEKGDELYHNAYFCNQFKTVDFTKES